MEDISIRLREYRIRSNIKMSAIASATGVANETLIKWEKGTSLGNIEDYFKLKNYLDNMEGKLEEAFERESQKPAKLRLPFNNALPAVPQTDLNTASGTVIFTGNEPALIVDLINVPFLGNIEGILEVTEIACHHHTHLVAA